jgi:hypothetical protein
MSEIGRHGREVNGPSSNMHVADLLGSLRPAESIGGMSEEITSPYTGSPEEFDHERPGREMAAHFAADIEASRAPHIERYLSSLGLRVATMATVDESRREEVNRVMAEKTGMSDSFMNMGGYNTYIDMGFIFRNPEWEALNGPAITDSVRVHEGAHGSSHYRTIRQIQDDGGTGPTVARNGLVVKNTDGVRIGTFLEEAWAEHVRGRYIAEDLGKPGGFADWQTDIIKMVDPRDGAILFVPAQYARNARLAPVEVSDASHAGAAFDYLVQRDPGLEAAAIEARHSVEGLREVAGRLNRIDDGLYVRLRRPRFEHDFLAGLKHVQAVLGIT